VTATIPMEIGPNICKSNTFILPGMETNSTFVTSKSIHPTRHFYKEKIVIADIPAEFSEKCNRT
jgi:hypothetical protein